MISFCYPSRVVIREWIAQKHIYGILQLSLDDSDETFAKIYGDGTERSEK